jgi:hypothetical protein
MLPGSRRGRAGHAARARAAEAPDMLPGSRRRSHRTCCPGRITDAPDHAARARVGGALICCRARVRGALTCCRARWSSTCFPGSRRRSSRTCCPVRFVEQLDMPARLVAPEPDMGAPGSGRGRARHAAWFRGGGASQATRVAVTERAKRAPGSRRRRRTRSFEYPVGKGRREGTRPPDHTVSCRSAAGSAHLQGTSAR